jgi:hypothetical protein
MEQVDKRNPMLIGFRERERRENGGTTDTTVTEISRSEFDALCLSLDKKRLRKRLSEAKSVLLPEYRKLFRPGIFKANERALYSEGLRYRLQWQTRRYPDAPESYENQQTSIGAVYLVELPIHLKTAPTKQRRAAADTRGA